jgi:hypothetical protein
MFRDTASPHTRHPGGAFEPGFILYLNPQLISTEQEMPERAAIYMKKRVASP